MMCVYGMGWVGWGFIVCIMKCEKARSGSEGSSSARDDAVTKGHTHQMPKSAMPMCVYVC
jgi:hypothetical protein